MSRVTTITCSRCGELCGSDMLALNVLAGDTGHVLDETIDLCGDCRTWFTEAVKSQQKQPAATEPETKQVPR